MDFTSYLVDNALILVPVMYFIGFCIKNTKVIKDKYIPIILLPIGILFFFFFLGFNVNSVIQGILITGATVYTNQLLKQKDEEE